MNIPKEIQSKHRIRDYAICRDYISGKSAKEIVKDRNLDITVRRCEQILYENSAFVNKYIAWPKSKRLRMLQRWVDDKIESGQATKKDVADLLEQIRKEAEGDSPLIDNSKHLTIHIEKHEPYNSREQGDNGNGNNKAIRETIRHLG